MFRIGQRVMCINAFGAPSIEHGKIYTVKRIGEFVGIRFIKVVDGPYIHQDVRFVALRNTLQINVKTL